MLFLVYPIILASVLQMFSCTTIEGNIYLEIYMNDECWTGDHAIYTMSVALPAFILWGIGLPFLSFLTIQKISISKELESLTNRSVLGFLYLGYIR